MNKYIRAISFALLYCLLSVTSKADLLGVSPSYPQINYVNTDTSAISYDPATGMLTINALPYDILYSETDMGSMIVSNNNLQIQLGTDGTMLSGTNGFLLTGQFTHIVGGVTNTYSGTLLQGDVTAFGSQANGGSAQFDFVIHLTGGLIQSDFNCANTFAIEMSSEVSTFTGDFTVPFNGSSKGFCGPEDTTPPVITCPDISTVTTTATIDPATGLPGFLITYPNPVVTDNCDANPTIYCDTPSGTIVDLNPGDQLTINCYGIDASGNYSVCSFTVTMATANKPPCTLAWVSSNCAPVTLPTDPNLCSATYIFAPPVATNCDGSFVASVTAVDETGATIRLTTLTNGMVEGSFPHTYTTNGNVITSVVTDDMSNTVAMQCHVFVKDTQAPTIACLNQTACFAPIVTNAQSCISACFNTAGITAGDTIWFNSVVQNTSCRNTCGNYNVHIFDQTITLYVDNTNITLTVPESYVHFSNGVSVATTVFTNNQWVTYVNANFNGKAFASGLNWQVPFNLNNQVGNCWGRDQDRGCFRRQVKSVTWCARYGVDCTGVVLDWQWGAVVQQPVLTNAKTLAPLPDNNSLCVKPVDDCYSSCWKNNDCAGSCEATKSCINKGATGNGWCWDNYWGWNCDTTGVQSQEERINVGKGIVCEGVVNFKTPTATDNCDSNVKVTCNPPSGSLFGPGKYTINCTAVDSSGNSNTCSFTLTVLTPVQVVFDSPACDNVDDNTAEPDKGFSDFNCPDDPSTPAYVNCFHPGDQICHVVRLLDCNGNDITSSLSSCCTVHLDVTERCGTFCNSVLVSDVPQKYSGIGCPGNIMVPYCGTFQYNLCTSGFKSHTLNTTYFYRGCAWVEYNSCPGVPVGCEDVLLQSY